MIMPIQVLIDETVSEATVRMKVQLDPTCHDLDITYEGASLPERESLVVGYRNGQIVRLVIDDFTLPQGQAWKVSATPLTREASGESCWQRSGATIYDEANGPSPYGEIFVPVTVTAETTEAGATQQRKKTIHIKIRTDDPMPGTIALG